MQSILQSTEWEEFRRTQGWQTHRINGVLVLERSLPLGHSFLYVPEVTTEELGDINLFIKEIDEKIKKNNQIMLRIDYLTEYNQNRIENLQNNKLVKSFEEIQPEWRQIIPISISEEEILAQMKSKGRYNIRVAQKHGVVIEKSDKIEIFYDIFKQTAKRDGFQVRPLQYFQKMMEILKPAGLAELLVAKYNNKPVAAEIVTFYKDTASYLYGASSNEDRNVMAPYLMHWEAIKLAKEKGCSYYDLLAVEPEDRDEKCEMGNGEKSHISHITYHKYHGITRFKEQFGGRTVHLLGAWDMVYQPAWYKAFKWGEKLRRK